MFGKRLDSEIGDKSVQMTSFSTKVSSSSDVIDEKFYEKTIRASALKSDFEILPGGDSTEIGEKVCYRSFYFGLFCKTENLLWLQRLLKFFFT